jgi:hypothetical protein
MAGALKKLSLHRPFGARGKSSGHPAGAVKSMKLHRSFAGAGHEGAFDSRKFTSGGPNPQPRHGQAVAPNENSATVQPLSK